MLFIGKRGARPRHTEEIAIRSAPIPATCAALLACHLFAAPIACADEFDWVYFPMYANDSAHAVHLSSLKFRPDGLLSAATRYPRTGDEHWTAQESKAGWYTYDERLIDCETGFFAETASSLLGQDGAKVATRAEPHAEQVKRLEAQLQEANGKNWPNNSDVFLACAAASSPTFKKQRAIQAATVQALFSDRSLVTVLSADTAALSAMMRMRYDFSRIERKPAASAIELFQDMRSQYASWRRSINAAHVPVVAADEGRDQALRIKVNQRFEQARLKHVVLKSIKGAVLDYVYPAEPDYRLYRATEPGGLVLETTRIDCENGVAVPIARQSIRPDGRALPNAPLRVKAVMADIQQRYAVHGYMDGEGPFGGHYLEEGPAAVCQLVAQARGAGVEEAAAPVEDESGFAYGIKPGALDQHATLAAMLLAIRDARRNHAR
jgi:hypothetical protein